MRVGVLVHPTRPVQRPLEVLRRWAAAHDVELVQLRSDLVTDDQPWVAPTGTAAGCELVVAVGGDGTVLSALHAAAPTHTPVLGVACGSLGALTAVPGGELAAGLDRVKAGDWAQRRVPALTVTTDEGAIAHAVNDLSLVRHGGAQLVVEVWLGADLYVRIAGDGIVVATALGSSAYSMAAGGSLLVAGARAFVCTPLAMHGGSAPPLVVPDDREVTLKIDPGHSGFDLEVDGRRVASTARHYAIASEDAYATLVELGDIDSGLPGLRRRGLIADSPRVLARDRRAAHLNAEQPLPGPPPVADPAADGAPARAPADADADR